MNYQEIDHMVDLRYAVEIARFEPVLLATELYEWEVKDTPPFVRKKETRQNSGAQRTRKPFLSRDARRQGKGVAW